MVQTVNISSAYLSLEGVQGEEKLCDVSGVEQAQDVQVLDVARRQGGRSYNSVVRLGDVQCGGHANVLWLRKVV